MFILGVAAGLVIFWGLTHRKVIYQIFNESNTVEEFRSNVLSEARKSRAIAWFAGKGNDDEEDS